MKKSWAEVTTTNKSGNQYRSAMEDWPDLSSQNKGNIEGTESAGSLSDGVTILTNAMKQMRTNEIGQESLEIPSTKSQDEIRAERKLRRRAKKIEKDEKRLQEKLVQIREPKTQKVKIVDQVVMETYLENQQISSSSSRQSKSKNHSAVKVNLLDLINAQVVKPIDRSFIQNKQTTKLASSTQRHKGKKREFQKKKYVSKLKRSILLSRLMKNHIKSNIESLVTEQKSNDLVEPEAEPQCDAIESTAIQNDSTSSEQSSQIIPPSVKFSRKFRPYCDNYTSPELLSLAEALLRDIFRFQDRAYNKNEIKARSQKRFVVGFKETMRQLDIGKVKLLIIAPDLEQSSEAGGIIETIDEMKMKCRKSNVPYLFSLRRRQLGYVLFKKVPVSCVAVLNYQGSEETVQKLLPLIQEEKERFQSAITDESDNK